MYKNRKKDLEKLYTSMDDFLLMYNTFSREELIRKLTKIAQLAIELKGLKVDVQVNWFKNNNLLIRSEIDGEDNIYLNYCWYDAVKRYINDSSVPNCSNLFKKYAARISSNIKLADVTDLAFLYSYNKYNEKLKNIGDNNNLKYELISSVLREVECISQKYYAKNPNNGSEFMYAQFLVLNEDNHKFYYNNVSTPLGVDCVYFERMIMDDYFKSRKLKYNVVPLFDGEKHLNVARDMFVKFRGLEFDDKDMRLTHSKLLLNSRDILDVLNNQIKSLIKIEKKHNTENIAE